MARGEVVFRVYGTHGGRDRDSFFGCFRTEAEARAEIATLEAKTMHGENWARRYHNKGFVIRPVQVETDFEPPLLPAPRDRYTVRLKSKARGTEQAHSAIVEVFRRGASGASGGLERVCAYERDYPSLGPFEPFRQGGRDYALVSTHYTRTAVLDLASGAVIAEELEETPGWGFCPVGFYVPDWWDVNDGTSIPGSEYWSEDREWPVGDFGFVWGCVWGDDTSWKVQYLDLSRIRAGLIKRDDRFGYVPLATRGYESPVTTAELPAGARSRPPPFIRVSRYNGVVRVGFDVEQRFELATGGLLPAGHDPVDASRDLDAARDQGDHAQSARLSSNGGGQHLTIESGSSSEYANEAGIDATIELRGLAWDGDHAHPTSTTLTGMWLRPSDVATLRDVLLRWLAQPLDQLTPASLVGDFELAWLPGQSLNVVFGPREDTESKRLPAVTIRFAAGALRGESHFVTDPSCLEEFVRGLSALLATCER